MSETIIFSPEHFRLPADFSAAAANINTPPPSWKFSPQEEQTLERLVEPYGGIWVKSFFFYKGEYTPSGENMDLFFSQEQVKEGIAPFYSLIKRPLSKDDSIYSLNLGEGPMLEMNKFKVLDQRLSMLLSMHCGALQESPAARL